jgi:hypothetical protein
MKKDKEEVVEEAEESGVGNERKRRPHPNQQTKINPTRRTKPAILARFRQSCPATC